MRKPNHAVRGGASGSHCESWTSVPPMQGCCVSRQESHWQLPRTHAEWRFTAGWGKKIPVSPRAALTLKAGLPNLALNPGSFKYSFLLRSTENCGGAAVAQWLKCCATNRKVAGSIPAGVSGFFIDIKSLRSHYGPGVDPASNRNEYQDYFLGVKAAGA